MLQEILLTQEILLNQILFYKMQDSYQYTH
ncbi:hypothetical protein HmCmsJML117_02346 [Escherichia coli]|nr:hypothetical protein HmCmsJML117_02346 [Escherichia coli]